MDIEVRFNSKYREIILTIDNTRIESGLLDKDEAKEIADKFISAAEDLLRD